MVRLWTGERDAPNAYSHARPACWHRIEPQPGESAGVGGCGGKVHFAGSELSVRYEWKGGFPRFGKIPAERLPEDFRLCRGTVVRGFDDEARCVLGAPECIWTDDLRVTLIELDVEQPAYRPAGVGCLMIRPALTVGAEFP